MWASAKALAAIMGWEWRVFFKLESTTSPTFDIWRALGSNMRGSGEKRTDSYLAMSADYGLKLRGHDMWELKERQKYSEDGLEKWVKYRLSAVRNANELASYLTAAGLPQAGAILERNGIHMVDTKKQRYQVDWESVVLEQVDCELDLPEERGGVQRLRSICCEGEESQVRAQSKRILSMLREGSVDFRVEGYPEMICRVLEINS